MMAKVRRLLKEHPSLQRSIYLSVLVGIVTVIIWIVYCNVWSHASTTPDSDFTKMAVTTVITQTSLSVFTFLALCVSLWVAGFNRLFFGPRLTLKSTFDDLHCVLANDPNSTPVPTQAPYLSIYIHVENSQAMSAEDCSVTCNEIYVSVDGIDYYKYKTIQTASFKWSYAKQEDPYVTTVRRTVEKYARIIEIRQQPTDDTPTTNTTNGSETLPSDSTDGHVARSLPRQGQPPSWFEVLLPMTSESKGSIQIPSRYHGLLLPISVVSKNTSDEIFYCKIVWKGDDVTKYKQAGYLQMSVVTEAFVRNLIKE